MKPLRLLFTLTTASLLAGTTLGGRAGDWPQFRGPEASGVSKEGTPTAWNISAGEHLRWQTPIPGLGSLFLTKSNLVITL